MKKAVILDGYVDEPTCLGVPPYISPYVRYIAGAIVSYDKLIKIQYYTIDQLRNNNLILESLFSNTDLLVVIAGSSVPGKYLSGYPISPFEILKFFSNLHHPFKILVGPAARYGFGLSGGKKVIDREVIKNVFDTVITGDPEIVISELLKNKLKIEKIDTTQCKSSQKDIKKYAVIGAKIVKQHPNYPDYLIAEIETYRGCARNIVGGCSFCSEPSKGLPMYRSIKDIVDEIKSLYDFGIRHFRLGNQPCIFSYQAKGAGELEFPKPNPEIIEKLFKGIRNNAPYLKTLHIDNVNPGVIANYPNESKKIAKIIVRYHTPGDVAAFGIESADPQVIKKNNLKVDPSEALFSIKLLNEIGQKRGENGFPELLPGLNFVFGLDGETKKTFDYNYDFLNEILSNNLLVRRINLRQVIPIPGTKMWNIGDKFVKKHKKEFKRFKRKVHENIERPLLQRMLPFNTLIKDVYFEKYEGKLTFGRQIGSYPLLIGIPGIFSLNKFYNVKIVGYGYRSLTAIPYPININDAPKETLEAIPGIGKKRVLRILAKRPIKKSEELYKILDDEKTIKNLFNYFN